MTRSTPARLYQLRSKITISPAAGRCWDISLDIHLRLLALGRRRQRDDTKHPRADTFGDRLDHAALAGAVAPLEHDADLQAFVHHPLLELDQLDMQLGQLAQVVLLLQLAVGRFRDLA